MTTSFDRIADRYDATRAYTPAGMRRAVGELGRTLGAEGRLLEVGVGTGRFALPLQERGLDVTGLDVSRGMLAKARAKGVGQLLAGDARRMPFRDRAFRNVLSAHVTHLISDWPYALSEIGRVATDRLVSVVLERTGSEAERMQTLYEEACAEHGHEVCHPGLRERELADLVAPRMAVEVSDEEDHIPGGEAVERYRQRTYSDQWAVPEDVHRLAVRRLEEEFSSAERVWRRERISILAWDLDDIRVLTSRLGP